jgi:hypothetical protein
MGEGFFEDSACEVGSGHLKPVLYIFTWEGRPLCSARGCEKRRTVSSHLLPNNSLFF